MTFSQDIQAYILDMDGVLWRGEQPIGDLPEIFRRIAHQSRRVILATNNATRTPDMYVERLRSYGVQLTPDQIIHSGQVAARYLRQQHPQGGAVYLIGEDGIRTALLEAGFTLAEDDVVAVVVSMDRQLTYQKLLRATLLIRCGVPFIATNSDRTFPTPEGLVPGAGAILAALETACDRKAALMGKPRPAMYEAALERLGLAPGQVLVVGDRVETDIEGAQAIGCRTALVLSGVTTPQQAQAWRPAPDVVAPDLAAVVGAL